MSGASGTETDTPVGLAAIAALDLGMVRAKLADPIEGKGWSVQQLDLAEQEYRRFLLLCLATGEPTVPCELVDEMWHAHILDTQAYHADCERIFGFYYHHFPYFGMRGEQDAQDLVDAYERTVARYVGRFGEPPAGVWTEAASGKCKRTACKPVKCR